ncbi:MAG TPA: DUF4157 domain-containing protein [Pyrinomonadaceae bacterium]|jgi:hypothetical protein|nr:DUF4157 domain-containing protein [Pyrinomonadaceae bacterium]
MKFGNFDLTKGPKDLVKNAVETRLPKPLRQEMEKAFDTDFSQLKVYESHLPTLNGAKSYVTGNAIHFAPGGFDPFSDDGRKQVAHELAHVVQQRQGRVAVQLKETLAEAISDGQELLAEADRMGDQAMQM